MSIDNNTLDWMVSEIEARKQDERLIRWNICANELVNAREGIPPARYANYFKDLPVFHDINKTRSALDDLIGLAHVMFQINVRPRNSSSRAKDDAEKVERVLYSYACAAALQEYPEYEQVKYEEIYWLILTGESVTMVLADHENQTPYFWVRDPRGHYPPIGHIGGKTPLTNTMFSTSTPLHLLKHRFPNANLRIYEKATFASGFRTEHDPRRPIEVVEYYSDEAWIAATREGILLTRTEHDEKDHPGVQPVVTSAIFDGVAPKGRPILADQLGLNMAAARVLSQEMKAIDKKLSPLLFVPPVEGGVIRRDKPNIIDYQAIQGMSPRVEKVAPDSPLNGLQIMSWLLDQGRDVSRNPESFQGSGDADSAKALAALREGPEGWVNKHIWTPFRSSDPKKFTTAMKIDQKLWGNVRKEAGYSKRGGDYQFVNYVPNTTLRGYIGRVHLKFDNSTPGVMNEVTKIQRLSAGTMTMDDYLEADAGISEPRVYKKQLQLDAVEKGVLSQAIPALLPQQQALLWKTMQEENIEVMDAWVKLSEQGAFDPPAPPEGAPPGIPPELMQIMDGGGQDPLAQGAMPLPPSPRRTRAALPAAQ